jgi:lysozyme
MKHHRTMNDDFHLGATGVALIKAFESCQLVAYIDTHDAKGKPVFAAGWGHTTSSGPPPVHEGDQWTRLYADQVFLDDAKVYEDKVHMYINVKLSQNQFDAMVCFCFNVATAHFIDAIAKSGINDGKYDIMPSVLNNYVINRDGRRLQGLVKRRKLEGLLWAAPDGTVPDEITKFLAED